MGTAKALGLRAALLLALVASLNLLVDPFDERGTRLLPPLTLGTRHTKLLYYRARRPPPDVVVLGSSRAFTVDPAYIEQRTGRPAFNASMHAASLQDYLDFAGCMVQAGSFPRTLIVALGPEQFPGPTQLTESRDPLAECRTDPRTTSLASRLRWPSALTLGEMWGSLRSLRLASMKQRPLTAYTDVAPDGLLRPRVNEPLEEVLDRTLAGEWNPSRYDFDALQPVSLESWRRFLDLCRAHGADVIVYVPPLHPRALAVYGARSHFTELRRQLVALLGDEAREHRLAAHDFTEPASYGSNGTEFIDASHPDIAGDRRIVDALVPDLRRPR